MARLKKIDKLYNDISNEIIEIESSEGFSYVKEDNIFISLNIFYSSIFPALNL